ncbi:MAG: UDP-2,3-diacylglucosamine diphosphatase LpxI [Pirellulales bacterium]|nr:UDP-2,3-diacylglucosamine diphosphatase LpxI [Pirellulales bacterium]
MQPGPVRSKERIGLVAGWGRYPLVMADALRDRGYEVITLGVKDHCDPALAAHCTEFGWVGLGRLGAAIRFFRRHGVTRATMAGKIHKVRLYQPWALIKHLPDLRTVRRFYPHFLSLKRDRKDDTLLQAVVDEFATGGITFCPATDFAPELLVKLGQLTRLGPTKAQRADIEFGWRVAKAVGGLDIGQSVAVKGRATLAVEAIEGTDLCIQRAGSLCPAGGFTVVKVAKPRQDMRFDVPTIGLGTLQTMAAAGGSVLAIEAGRTILLDEAEVLQFADAQRIAVVALAADGQFDAYDSHAACA